MNKIIIEDRLEEKVANPIEVVFVLNDTTNNGGFPFFKTGTLFKENVDKMVRLYKTKVDGIEYDFLEVHEGSIVYLCLGHWNSGRL